MRQWISIRGPGGLRFGQNIGPEDFGPPKLPSWRRYELRKGLQPAVGRPGQVRAISYPSTVEAFAALQRQQQAKQRRGYQ